MQVVTLKFPSIIELVDYLFVYPDCHAAIDHEKLMLSGTFPTAAIELAINGYKAKVLKIKINKDGVMK